MDAARNRTQPEDVAATVGKGRENGLVHPGKRLKGRSWVPHSNPEIWTERVDDRERGICLADYVPRLLQRRTDVRVKTIPIPQA